MLEKFKKLQLLVVFINSLVFVYSGSLVRLFIIREIDDDFYKFIVWLEQILLILVFLFVDRKSILDKLRDNFNKVVLLSISIFVAGNLAGLFCIEVRVVITTISDCVTEYLWFITIDDMWNNILSKSDITLWNNRQQKFRAIGAIIGSSLLLVYSCSFDQCLIIQAVIYSFCGLTDLYIFNKLKGVAYK